jgi:hypothetical protein
MSALSATVGPGGRTALAVRAGTTATAAADGEFEVADGVGWGTEVPCGTAVLAVDGAAATGDDLPGANGDDLAAAAGDFVAAESAAGPLLPEAFMAGSMRSVSMARRSCLALPPERKVV